MKIKYGLISCDSHAQLDKDNWTKRMSKAKWGDAIPQLRETTDKAHMIRASDKPVERWFVYLPFEHAEDLAAQRHSVALFGGLAGDPDCAGAIDYAHRHYSVIARFGRFPHRNAILGRESTAEETAFLSQPGASF